MTKFITLLQDRVAAHKDEDEGATMVEYGLMVSLIAIIAMAGAGVLGIAIDAIFDAAAAAL
ncbi:MAG: Flp family type IVb pilin [Acidimicrobiia bacterium]